MKLGNQSSIIILLLFISLSFQAFIDPQPLTHLPNLQIYDELEQAKVQASRFLQAGNTNDKNAAAALKKILADSNAVRKGKGLTTLSENPNLNQIISQWSQVMRKNMQLTQYLQIYGIQNTQTQYYASIPVQMIGQVIENISFSLYDGDYNKVGVFSSEVSRNNYEVILVFQGGEFAQTITYTQDIIQNAINKLNKEKKPVNNVVVQPANSTKQATPANAQKSNLTQSTSKNQSNNQMVNTTYTTSPQPTQPNITINITQPEAPQTNSTKIQSSSVQTNITSKPDNNTESKIDNKTDNQVDTKAPSYEAPLKPTSQPANTIQTTPILLPTANITSPPIVAPILNTTSINRTQPPKAQQTVLSQLPTNNQTQNTTSVRKNTKSTYPKQAINNTDSFPNINLYHNVPTTFLKNQLFPFRGSITIPNPSGRQVNVILTRISDQQRLPFSQWLSANQTQFFILANMNMTGDYYLSIFVGNSGLTSLVQYTIAPSAIGPFSSKPPIPVSEAELTLVGNTLWLNWSYSDPVQPAITQIIFTQDNRQSIQFILSNYECKFKVPYKMFYAFNQGVANIQISQAFSADQSAASRNSPFSAPFNIIFNATTHNYEIFGSSNTFNPISLKYPKGGSINIAGPAGAQLQNEVYLITPSKVFETYYLIPNSSLKYIEKGTLVNLTINLNESGVYIFQINHSGGQALINIPLYVGDIYPLKPDFMDLSPNFIDLAALNEPTLLADRRSMVLQLINNIRNAYGAQSVYLDNNLNNLAQNYSLAQIQGNFIGHIDRQGRSPSQRAIAANIFEGVGQNIAMNNNLTNAQLMLQRSPAHLKNMVNPTWTRVGLGILQNSNGFYYLTQQFSSRDFTLNPLTASEIRGIQEDILNFIIPGQDKVLSSKLDAYQAMSDRPYIISYLQGVGYRNLAVANLQVSYNNGNYLTLIEKGTSFEPTSTAFRQMGIAVTYEKGLLQIFVAYI